MPPIRDRRIQPFVSRLLLVSALSTTGISNTGLGLADTASRAIESDRTEDGTWAVAGTSRHDGYRGTDYVYRRAGRSWVLDATLAPPERFEADLVDDDQRGGEVLLAAQPARRQIRVTLQRREQVLEPVEHDAEAELDGVI